jgi:hypothetical protein
MMKWRGECFLTTGNFSNFDNWSKHVFQNYLTNVWDFLITQKLVFIVISFTKIPKNDL